jgi:hypothetical protein
MADGVDVKFVDREFNAAIRELAESSSRADYEVLTGQAIHFLRSLVKFTRLAGKKSGGRDTKGRFAGGYKRRGRARAGWWPSWLALGAFGVPRGTNARVLGEAEGTFRDGRQRRGDLFVVMTNEVNYIEKLDSADHILRRAGRERFDDMQREIERRYRREMSRRSG